MPKLKVVKIKEVSNALNIIKKRLTKQFGKPCNNFEITCPTCQAWFGYKCLKSVGIEHTNEYK